MLLAAPAFAVSLVVETGQNVNPGSGVSYYESINFAGSGSISQTAMIFLDGVYGEHAGDIWVGDGVSGTITSAADNGIYLQHQTGASAGYIQGASRDTSTLTFAGNAISTQNNAEQDLYVKDITLNMRKDLSSNNFIRGAGICFENATVNILYSDVGDTNFISGGISNLTDSRNYIFNNSTLNVNAVCEGIRDVFRAGAKLSADDAEVYYLRYMNYVLPEKARAYEEQFLADFAKSNRSYARTPSGVTYAVEVLGDQEQIPVSDRDSVALRYIIRTADGADVYSSYERRDTLRTSLGSLNKGMKESVKLIGKGGKINAWMPSAVAYGSAGDKELGIRPNATLYYEIELVDLDKYTNWSRRNNLRR